MSSELKEQIKAAMKDAMRAKEKARLGTIRMIQAEIKRVEVDERIDVDDARVLVILDRMCKQRRDSISQYEDAGRSELADIERAEMDVIHTFLPAALSDAEIENIVTEAIAASGAESARDMGKVMGLIKPRIQGRADMGAVSRLVKSRLA